MFFNEMLEFKQEQLQPNSDPGSGKASSFQCVCQWDLPQASFQMHVLRISMQIHRTIYMYTLSNLFKCFMFVIPSESFCSCEITSERSSGSSQDRKQMKVEPLRWRRPTGHPAQCCIVLVTRPPHCPAAFSSCLQLMCHSVDK